MSKQLWTYPRSRVQITKTDGTTLIGVVTDYIDEMDNDEQDEISFYIDEPNPIIVSEIGIFENEIASIKILNDNVIELGEDVVENRRKFGRLTKMKEKWH